MRITFIFILIPLLHINAFNIHSQTNNFNFKKGNMSIAELISAVEAQSEYLFLYSEKDIDVNQKVHINNTKNLSIPKVLEQAFMDSNVVYSLNENYISLQRNKQTTLQSFKKKIISGTIIDENGEALIGASVMEKGTNNGTITDIEGKFSLNIDEKATLIISYLGFESQEISIGNQNNISIILKENIQNISEVVVVGYGTMKKVDLTGSVISADIEAFKEAPNTNILESLKGAIPGLQIGQTNQASAEPSITIRGRNSINGNTLPLIVVDNIIYNGRIGDLNPSDILSVNILKDASSKAIYGAQAANGVLLITTKAGRKSEKPTISYSGSIATQSPTVDTRLRNSEENIQIIRDIYYKKSYIGPDYTQINPDWDFSQSELVPAILKGIEDGTDYNWWDALTSPGYITDHVISATGGLEKTSYYLSGGFTQKKGFIENDNYKRFSVKINLDTEITNWLSIGANAFGAFTDISGLHPNLGLMALSSPFVTPTDENGEYIPYPAGGINILNPFLNAMADNKNKRNRINGTFYGVIKIPHLTGLQYRINFSNDYSWTNNYTSAEYLADFSGQAYKEHQQRYDQTIDNILSYDNKFGDHSVSGTFVAGYRRNEADWTRALAENIANLGLSFNNLEQGVIQKVNSTAWKETYLYQMGRISYNYQNRYMMTATLRRDGFSGFSKNNKYALFPSIGLGWVLTNESFISIPKVDFFKLRASYGSNGNMAARYSSIARISTGDGSKYVFGDGASTAMGQSVSSLANDNLSWEKTLGFNIGFDFSAFNDRIGGNLDYYNNTTTDLLWDMAIPRITGFSQITTNIGKIKNTGWEFMLRATPIKTKDLEWDINLNFSANKNKIVSLLGEDKDKDGREDDLISSNLFIGKSIGTIYGYEIDGIWQIGDDIMEGYNPGNYRIVDQDGDGKITADKDRVFLGKTEPAYSFGIQNSLRYRDFTFRFFINSIQGGKNSYLGANDPDGVSADSSGNLANTNTFTHYDFWSVTNPDAKYAINYQVPQIKPSRFLSRNFVRLQDISLSYNFNSDLLKRIGVGNLKVYISGKNLLTFTDWDGWDPETGQGIGNANAYPVLKSYSLGLDISF